MLSTFLFFLTVSPVGLSVLEFSVFQFFLWVKILFISFGVLCMITTLFPAIEIKKPKNNFRIPFLFREHSVHNITSCWHVIWIMHLSAFSQMSNQYESGLLTYGGCLILAKLVHTLTTSLIKNWLSKLYASGIVRQCSILVSYV